METEKIVIPKKITKSQKAEVADELLEIRQQTQMYQERKKRYDSAIKERVEDLAVKETHLYKVLQSGTIETEVVTKVFKNYETSMIEYLDPEDGKKVLHKRPFEPGDEQMELSEGAELGLESLESSE